MNLYTNNNIAVVGLGRAGRSTIDLLHRCGANIYAWDDCEDVRECIVDPDIHLVPPIEFPWKSISALVLSPGIPLTYPKPHDAVKLAIKYDCPIICDIELLYNLAPLATYIGITGTNGKSTTTALIGHILTHSGIQTCVGGNFGVPASRLPLLDSHGVYVLEISSYQLDLLQETKFDISILLNIAPDHIDRHGTFEVYMDTKKSIFERCRGVGIFALDDPYTTAIYNEISSCLTKMIPVSGHRHIADGISVINLKIFDNRPENQSVLPLRDCSHLPGKHNQQNIAAAYAAVQELKIAKNEFVNLLQTFRGLRHRLQIVNQVDGITFVNDSKATNAISTASALDSFDSVLWIVGGLEKEGGISALKPLFYKVEHAFLIGASQDQFARTLGTGVSYTKCGNVETALNRAINAVGTGSTILFSPACASFDQFSSFEHRGDYFIELVRKKMARLKNQS